MCPLLYLLSQCLYVKLKFKLTTAKSISSSPSVLGSRSLAALPETRSSETTTKEKNMIELFCLKQNTIAVSTEWSSCLCSGWSRHQILCVYFCLCSVAGKTSENFIRLKLKNSSLTLSMSPFVCRFATFEIVEMLVSVQLFYENDGMKVKIMIFLFD